ncbi:MAG TPA: alpha/beta fold hydrolase [Blastocatellia bacterium]|nr:alpha/beta fold hydrolase [Blastocatellia bacterium]
MFKRVIWVVIPAVLVLGVGVMALNFYLIYRITHPPRAALYGSPRDFQIILQKPMWSDEKWTNTDSTESVGWFLKQARPSPTVILSHAYGTNRSDFLSLSFELWKAGYNVLVYDMRGHGESPVSWSGLGTYEKDDLLSSIKFLKSLKTDGGESAIDGRIGLYGVGVGGYISLVASAQDPMIKAVAVDSVYPDVAHFLNYKIKTYVGSETGWVHNIVESEWANRLTQFGMQLYLLRREDSAPAVESVTAASERKFLFITGKNTGPFEEMTKDLHQQANGPKELVEVAQTRLDRLYTKASIDYDKQVVRFFQQALPTTSGRTNALAKAGN